MLYIKNRELEWNSDFFAYPTVANALCKVCLRVFICVYMGMFVCTRSLSWLSAASCWDRLEFWFSLCVGRVCVYVRLAPLVLSLIPVSGKHQPFKTQMAGFFFPLSPRSPPHTKFGEQLGRPCRWFVSFYPSSWQVESMHTLLGAHTHTYN